MVYICLPLVYSLEMNGKKYLEKHGKQWRVQVRIPPSLHGFFGKKKLVVPLHTDSLANANFLKLEVVAKLLKEIELAKRGQKSEPLVLENEGLDWRQRVEREKPIVEPITMPDGRQIDALYFPIRDELLPDGAREISTVSGDDAAQEFLKIATGEATPIMSMFQQFVLERKELKPKQASDYERAISRFIKWLASSNLPSSIEATDRKKAGRYIGEAMVAIGRHTKTANKDISALSSYWRWLMKRGIVEANPWAGQSISKKSAPKLTKRPYTDQEVKTLLDGAKDATLLDVIMIAALSGMRLSEIISLKSADIVDQTFNIREAKTDAGVRLTPIHSDLVNLIATRSADKKPTEFLFDEISGSDRTIVAMAMIITKRFITLRRGLGLEEKRDDQRQSNIDFHSFRRWFITKARDALLGGATGYDNYTIAEVVGHDTEGKELGLAMTMGRYAGRQSMDAKRFCVEAVKLPL
jgi:integrase